MTPTGRPLQVSIAVSDNALRRYSQQAVNSFLPSVIATCEMKEKGAQLLSAAMSAQPAVLVTDLAALGDDFGDTIRKLRSQPSPPDVVVLHHSADGGAILKAMRAGAREFFFEEIEDSVRETLSVIASRSRVPEANGKLHAFMAAKGGSGATTLAVHAAASLAQGSKDPVLLADLNWGCPSAAFLLRANPQYSLRDAARSMDRMDTTLWEAMVTPTSYGFAFAPPPTGLGKREAVEPEELSSLLEFCKRQYGNVVADCGDGANPLSPIVVEAADEIIVVTCSDVLSFHHAKNLIRAVQQMGGANRLRIVLNRVSRRPDLKQSDVEEMLGQPIFASVLNDYRALTQACEAGVLLDADHAFAQSVAAFTAQLGGSTPAPKKKLFGLFRN